jgi:methylated-DNA-[protein]-cysteine S-methyltransferase
MTTQTAVVEFPLGSFHANVEDGVVRSSGFDPTPQRGRRDRWGVADSLDAYFAGAVDALDTIAVEPLTGTPFQREVWKRLREIKAGTTESYGGLARRVGNPNASRAVGMANAANPVGLIVPCHRVIRSGGAIGGYGFGVELKRWLLEHEAKRSPLFS